MRYAAIEGYAHPYRISEAGVVESLRFGSWTPLTPTMNGYRHVVVKLRKNGGGQTKRSVAKLMADAFLGGVPAGHGVFHKNQAKWDNALENLVVRPLSFGGGDKSSKTVLKINRWGRVVEIYRNVAEAAQKNHISKSAIRERCLNMVADPFRLDGHNYQYESSWTGPGKRRKVEG